MASPDPPLPPAAAPQLSLRIDFDAGHRLGPGKICLLEHIDACGSISAAARKMSMSYRRAWTLIEALNDMFQNPVIATSIGGAGGGKAALTPLGHDIVQCYRQAEHSAAAAARHSLAALAGWRAAPGQAQS